MSHTDIGTFVIVTEASAVAPEGTVVHPPLNPEPFTTDFQSAHEAFIAEVWRQLEQFGVPHNHPFDKDDPDAFWEEDCPWCDDAMIWENWSGSEGLIVHAEDFDRNGDVAIGLSHVDVILKRA